MWKVYACFFALMTWGSLGGYELPTNYGPPPVAGSQQATVPTVVHETTPPSRSTNYQSTTKDKVVKHDSTTHKTDNRSNDKPAKPEKVKSSYEQAFDKPYGPPK